MTAVYFCFTCSGAFLRLVWQALLVLQRYSECLTRKSANRSSPKPTKRVRQHCCSLNFVQRPPVCLLGTLRQTMGNLHHTGAGVLVGDVRDRY